MLVFLLHIVFTMLCIISIVISYNIGYIEGFKESKAIDDKILEEMNTRYKDEE